MSISTNLYVIAAICGNFYQESTVNPGVWENLTVDAPGYGLGQWTNNQDTSRRTALFNYLDSHNYARDSGDGQLEFLVYENLWIPSLIQQSAYNTLTDYFASTSTSIESLVREFMFHWEGINDNSQATRINFAYDCLSLFQNDPGTRSAWYTGNRLLSSAEAQSNSLLVMDYFLGNTPPTPPTPPQPTYSRKQRLKPWFIDYIT